MPEPRTVEKARKDKRAGTRHGEARPKRAPAKAPNTLMRQARASESPDDGRASRAPCHGSLSANRAARRRALRSRSKRNVPPRAAPPLLVLRQPRKP
jgi:hypothetical protein